MTANCAVEKSAVQQKRSKKKSLMRSYVTPRQYVVMLWWFIKNWSSELGGRAVYSTVHQIPVLTTGDWFYGYRCFSQLI